MASEVGVDISVIKDEDLLRRMWQQAEDFGVKKEIRAHMYKLREERLRDFYTSDMDSENVRITKTPLTPSHGDSLNDQSFHSLKAKEVRDANSPTRDYSVGVKTADASGWNIVTSSEETPDGRCQMLRSIATTDTVRELPDGKATFAGKNEQMSTSKFDGDDKNFTQSSDHLSNSLLKEHVVTGDENTGRTETKTSVTTSSSKTESSSHQTTGDPQQFIDRSINRNISSSQATNEQNEQYFHETNTEEQRSNQTAFNNASTNTNVRVDGQHHSQHERTERNQYKEKSEMTKEEHQREYERLVALPGKITSRNVEYTTPDTRKITETKLLDDGTTVTTTKYENSEITSKSFDNRQQTISKKKSEMTTEERKREYDRLVALPGKITSRDVEYPTPDTRKITETKRLEDGTTVTTTKYENSGVTSKSSTQHIDNREQITSTKDDQKEYDRLVALPGKITSRNVEHPTPDTRKITETKILEDGTTVTTTKYEISGVTSKSSVQKSDNRETVSKQKSDMTKEERQREYERLSALPGKVTSRNVEYPNPDTRKITETKMLDDGTTVTTTNYERTDAKTSSKTSNTVNKSDRSERTNRTTTKEMNHEVSDHDVPTRTLKRNDTNDIEQHSTTSRFINTERSTDLLTSKDTTKDIDRSNVVKQTTIDEINEMMKSDVNHRTVKKDLSSERLTTSTYTIDDNRQQTIDDRLEWERQQNKRISVDHNPTHDAFARSLRCITPPPTDRGSVRSVRSNLSSVRSTPTKPKDHDRRSPSRETTQSTSSRISSTSFPKEPIGSPDRTKSPEKETFDRKSSIKRRTDDKYSSLPKNREQPVGKSTDDKPTGEKKYSSLPRNQEQPIDKPTFISDRKLTDNSVDNIKPKKSSIKLTDIDDNHPDHILKSRKPSKDQDRTEPSYARPTISSIHHDTEFDGDQTTNKSKRINDQIETFLHKERETSLVKKTEDDVTDEVVTRSKKLSVDNERTEPSYARPTISSSFIQRDVGIKKMSTGERPVKPKKSLKDDVVPDTDSERSGSPTSLVSDLEYHKIESETTDYHRQIEQPDDNKPVQKPFYLKEPVDGQPKPRPPLNRTETYEERCMKILGMNETTDVETIEKKIDSLDRKKSIPTEPIRKEPVKQKETVKQSKIIKKDVTDRRTNKIEQETMDREDEIVIKTEERLKDVGKKVTKDSRANTIDFIKRERQESKIREPLIRADTSPLRAPSFVSSKIKPEKTDTVTDTPKTKSTTKESLTKRQPTSPVKVKPEPTVVNTKTSKLPSPKIGTQRNVDKKSPIRKTYDDSSAPDTGRESDVDDYKPTPVRKKSLTKPEKISRSNSRDSPAKSDSPKRPTKCIATKTITLTTAPKILKSDDMENVIIDIQRAKSSREPTPNRIVPTPVSPEEDDGNITRYPDLVSEPDDTTQKRKPQVKNIPIFEEETNAYIGCEITEVEDSSSVTSEKVTTSSLKKTSVTDESSFDVQTKVSLFSSKIKGTDKPTPRTLSPTTKPSRPNFDDIDDAIKSDECLLTVNEKVNKFMTTADETSKPKVSPAFVADKTIDLTSDDDEYRLSVSDKVNKFITTAESIISPTRTDKPTLKPKRLELEDVTEDLKDDECLLSISDKVNKFTTKSKPVNESPVQKSTELVTKVDRKVTEAAPIKKVDKVVVNEEPVVVQKEVEEELCVKKIVKGTSPDCLPSHYRPRRKNGQTKFDDTSIIETPTPTPKNLRNSEAVRKAKSVFENTAEKPRGPTPRSPIHRDQPKPVQDEPFRKETVKPLKSKNPGSGSERSPTRSTVKKDCPKPIDDRDAYSKIYTDLDQLQRSTEKYVPSYMADTISSTEHHRDQYDETTNLSKHDTYEHVRRTEKSSSPSYMADTISSLDHRRDHFIETDERPRHDRYVDHSDQTSNQSRSYMDHTISSLEHCRDRSPTLSDRKHTSEMNVDVSGSIMSDYSSKNSPSYMNPTISSIEHRRSSRDRSLDRMDVEQTIKSDRSKFGVELKRTNSQTARRKSSSSDIPHIEEIFDLELLEKMLETVVGYEQRRRIRAQIRIVRKQIQDQLQQSINKIKKSEKVAEKDVTEITTKRTVERLREQPFETKTDVYYSRSPSPKSKNVNIDTNGSTSPPSYETIGGKPVSSKAKVDIHIKSEFTSDKEHSTSRSSSPIKTSTTRSQVDSKNKRNIELSQPKRPAVNKGTSVDEKPIWAQKNILKKASETTTTSSRSNKMSSSTSTTSTSVTKKRIDDRSTRQIDSDNCVTSSYGIGPTDEDGKPVFGLKALKKLKAKPGDQSVPTETTKVSGTIIHESYHSTDGSAPVGQRTTTHYSSDAGDLKRFTEHDTMTDNLLDRDTYRTGGLKRITKKEEFGNQKKLTIEPSSPPSTQRTKVVRRGSVKELSEKFIQKESESEKVTSSTSTYPKAGLILRTSRSSTPADRSGSVDLGDTDSDVEIRKTTVRTIRRSSGDDETIERSTRSTTSSSREEKTRSFLNCNTKVTDVNDVLERMRNADNVQEIGDTEDDREARSLFNKFLGASVLMTGMESMVANNTDKIVGSRNSKSDIKTTNTSKSSTSSSTIRQSSTQSSKSKKIVSSSPVTVEQTSDIEEIWNEDILKQLLDKSVNYEERRKLRARIRKVMADKEACAEIVASVNAELKQQKPDGTKKGGSVGIKQTTSVVSKDQGEENSDDEYEEVEEEVTEEEVTDEEVDEEEEEVDVEEGDTEEEVEEEEEEEVVVDKKPTKTTTKTTTTTTTKTVIPQKSVKTTTTITEKPKVVEATKVVTTTDGKVDPTKVDVTVTKSDDATQGESILLPLLQGLLHKKKPQHLLNARNVTINESNVVHIEDSGTESGEDLRLLAAGLHGHVGHQQLIDSHKDGGSNLLKEVTAALTRLEQSLRAGREIEVDGKKRESLLILVHRLQTGLLSPDKITAPTPAPDDKPIDAVPPAQNGDELGRRPSAGRFSKRRNRQNRHTVGVSQEELADARRLMQEQVLRDSMSNIVTPESPITPPEHSFDLQKHSSAGTVTNPSSASSSSTTVTFSGQHSEPSKLYRPNQFMAKHLQNGSVNTLTGVQQRIWAISQPENLNSTPMQPAPPPVVQMRDRKQKFKTLRQATSLEQPKVLLRQATFDQDEVVPPVPMRRPLSDHISRDRQPKTVEYVLSLADRSKLQIVDSQPIYSSEDEFIVPITRRNDHHQYVAPPSVSNTVYNTSKMFEQNHQNQQHRDPYPNNSRMDRRSRTPPPIDQRYDRSASKYNSRKALMKRANTIDIPKSFQFVNGYGQYDDDHNDDGDTEDGHHSSTTDHTPGLKSTVQVTVKNPPKQTVPKFRPKTDNDLKFLAFIQKQSTDNGLSWNSPIKSPQATTVPNWNNAFDSRKNNFEQPKSQNLGYGNKAQMSSLSAARNFWQKSENQLPSVKQTIQPQISRTQTIKNKLTNHTEQKRPSIGGGIPDRTPAAQNQSNIVTGSLRIRDAIHQPVHQPAHKPVYEPINKIAKPVPLNKFSHAPLSAFQPVGKKFEPKRPDPLIIPAFKPIKPSEQYQSVINQSSGLAPKTVRTPTSPNRPLANAFHVHETNQIKSPTTSLPWTNRQSKEHRVLNIASSKFEIKSPPPPPVVKRNPLKTQSMRYNDTSTTNYRQSAILPPNFDTGTRIYNKRGSLPNETSYSYFNDPEDLPHFNQTQRNTRANETIYSLNNTPSSSITSLVSYDSVGQRAPVYYRPGQQTPPYYQHTQIPVTPPTQSSMVSYSNPLYQQPSYGGKYQTGYPTPPPPNNYSNQSQTIVRPSTYRTPPPAPYYPSYQPPSNVQYQNGPLFSPPPPTTNDRLQFNRVSVPHQTKIQPQSIPVSQPQPVTYPKQPPPVNDTYPPYQYTSTDYTEPSCISTYIPKVTVTNDSLTNPAGKPIVLSSNCPVIGPTVDKQTDLLNTFDYQQSSNDTSRISNSISPNTNSEELLDADDGDMPSKEYTVTAKVMKGPVSQTATISNKTKRIGDDDMDGKGSMAAKNLHSVLRNIKPKSPDVPRNGLSSNGPVKKSIDMKKNVLTKLPAEFSREIRPPMIVETPSSPMASYPVNGSKIIDNQVRSTSGIHYQQQYQHLHHSADEEFHTPDSSPQSGRSPVALSKSDSWHQICQQQQQSKSSMKQPNIIGNTNQLQLSRSGNNLLSIPKQFEASVKKTEMNEKQRTVAAYFSGQKSPQSEVSVATKTIATKQQQQQRTSSMQQKKSSVTRVRTSEKASISKQKPSSGLARSHTMPQIGTVTTETKEIKKSDDGRTIVKTETVTTRTIPAQQQTKGAAPVKPISPFAKFRQMDKQVAAQSPPSSPQTPTTPQKGPAGTPMFRFTDPALNARAATVKDILLQWCQSKTKEYENVQISNFSAAWSDGLAFCALIHHFLPDAFDYSKLTPQERRHNFELAFRVADEKAGIAPLLDVEDMVIMKRPDWKCVFTYVQSIYRRFRNDP